MTMHPENKHIYAMKNSTDKGWDTEIAQIQKGNIGPHIITLIKMSKLFEIEVCI